MRAVGGAKPKTLGGWFKKFKIHIIIYMTKSLLNLFEKRDYLIKIRKEYSQMSFAYLAESTSVAEKTSRGVFRDNRVKA